MSIAMRKPRFARRAMPFVIFTVVAGTAIYLYVARIMRTAALVSAVDRNDTPVAVRLLEAGADANHREAYSDEALNDELSARTRRQGPPLLLKAATAGNAALVGALLTHGANPNARDSFNTTPLIGAAYSGDADAAQLLLQHGADVNVADRNGRTALSLACRYHHPNLVKLLISHGAQVSVIAKTGDTLLTEAATVGDLTMLDMLVRAGAAVNARNRDGQTLLLRAAAADSTALLRFLLERGADPEIAAKSGDTPLLYAARFRNAEEIRLLLEHHADPNAANQNGETPLMLLFGPSDQRIFHFTVPGSGSTGVPSFGIWRSNGVGMSGGFPVGLGALAKIPVSPKDNLRYCMKLLIAHGADVNHHTRNGDSVLIHACASADSETLRLLMVAGAKVDPAGKGAVNLVHAAACAASADNLSLLASSLPPMNLRGDAGIVDGAVWNPRVLKWLLDHGADANSPYGSTDVLHTAISIGKVEAVRVLLAHGARLGPKEKIDAALATLNQPYIRPQDRKAIAALLKASALAHP